MKESPGPWTPVAVFHSNNTSCCMFGTMVSCWRWGWVFSKDLATVGPGTAFWCSAFSVPRVTSTLMADWTWSWVFVGLERVTHNWKSPAVFQRCSAVVCTPPPLFLCGTERIERRGSWHCHALGENFTSHMETALFFFLNPLHFDVHLVYSPTENGLAQVAWAPWLNFTGELDSAVVNQGSHAVSRCGVKLTLGSLFPNALSGLSRMCWLRGAIQRGLSWQ